MSRSSSIIILGGLVLVGLTAVALLLFELGYFTVSSPTTMSTPALLDPIAGGTLDIKVTPPTLAATTWITATSAAETPGSSPTAVPSTVKPTQPSPVPIGQPRDMAVPTSCIDRATLIIDVTVPDGTQVAPGAGFNKTWRLLNNGSCTWENEYKVVNVGGPLLGAMSAEFPLNATVYPGQFHDLIINMVSPEARYL